KVLLVTEDNKEGSILGEVAAIIAEHCLFDLDAPIQRLAGPDIPSMPYAANMEKLFLVNPDKIEKAMRELAAFSTYREVVEVVMEKITMPQLGESVVEGTINSWLVKEGDHVNQYDPIADVMTDKVNAEIPTFFSGVIKNILIQEGETIQVGEVICYIET